MNEIQASSTKTAFKAVVHDEPEGGYWAEVPELPGCFTRGETLDEIYRNLIEAISCHLDLDMAQIRIGLLELASA
ncbi:MAG TPA: type II toxin-antitoxin system HicB family antitoxin [Thermoanaerobaculia bacterium]|nr:type II toxin-antitoxin system HicB family antitoxin [Thermoanaerobaculia bacterium]